MRLRIELKEVFVARTAGGAQARGARGRLERLETLLLVVELSFRPPVRPNAVKRLEQARGVEITARCVKELIAESAASAAFSV